MEVKCDLICPRCSYSIIRATTTLEDFNREFNPRVTIDEHCIIFTIEVTCNTCGTKWIMKQKMVNNLEDDGDQESEVW